MFPFHSQVSPSSLAPSPCRRFSGALVDLTVSMRAGSRNKQPPNLSRAVQRRCFFHSCVMLFMLCTGTQVPGAYVLSIPSPPCPPAFTFTCASTVAVVGREHGELCIAPKGSAKMWLMPLLLTFHWPLEVTWLSLNSKGAGKCNPALCPEEREILVNSTKDGCNDSNE